MSGKKKDSDGDYDGSTPREDRGGKASTKYDYEENQSSPIDDKDFDNSKASW